MTETPARLPWIVLVGGFLGAGKTSLIFSAARILARRGLRSAAILNDQGGELVDRRHAESQGLLAREVTGGCFCCRFSDLQSRIEELRSRTPDIIFAEPVGSCTDLAATVLGPLRETFHEYRIAPFTVLVDPSRAAALLGPGTDSDLAFLFKKQLQEADLVCLTKSDRYPNAVAIPDVPTRRVSAATGQGVEAWLDEILLDGRIHGARILDIDYARYAQAEAALAWLNLSFVLESDLAITPAFAIGPLLDGLDLALTGAGIEIVHLKLFASSASGWIKAAICGSGDEPRLEGTLDASSSARHQLLVNLRAIGDPAEVREVVSTQLRKMSGRVLDVHLDCFSPAAPQPERRIETAQLWLAGQGAKLRTA